MPEVSVIIPVYNESKYIRFCLDSLIAQTHPSYEIIAVDDGSTDGSDEIVAGYPQVHLLRQAHGGPGLARNLAAAHAAGEILVFCDADMAFAPDYVERLIQPIRANKATGTFSKEEYVANWDNVWARCWNLQYGLLSARRHPDDYPDEQSQFRAILRDQFVSVDGYDDVGYGEDRTIGEKLGKPAVVAAGAVCYHHNPASLFEVFRAAQWIGKGRGVPRNLITILKHTPPWAFKASIKRTWRYRNLFFPVFKMTYDLGIMIGIIRWWLRPGSHYQ